jgi:hypothetical protein
VAEERKQREIVVQQQVTEAQRCLEEKLALERTDVQRRATELQRALAAKDDDLKQLSWERDKVKAQHCAEMAAANAKWVHAQKQLAAKDEQTDKDAETTRATIASLREKEAAHQTSLAQERKQREIVVQQQVTEAQKRLEEQLALGRIEVQRRDTALQHALAAKDGELKQLSSERDKLKAKMVKAHKQLAAKDEQMDKDAEAATATIASLRQCSVCMDKPKTEFLHSCGHCFCEDCCANALKAGVCHFCRKKCSAVRPLLFES